MANPIPFVAQTSGDVEDAPAGAIPVALYGAGGGEETTVAWEDITDVPVALTTNQVAGTASVRTLGTGATQAAAGNHTHTFTALTGTVSGATGANLQAILNDLATRLTAAETTIAG